MKLFDTHCHFETTDEATIRATLERAKAAGVEALMVVGGSDALNGAALAARRIATTFCNARTLPRVLVALGFDREQIGVEPSAIHDSSFVIRRRLSAKSASTTTIRPKRAKTS